ncbi:hypothetical protein VTP01DRAFT_2484 [Rhizomucor pusillus]|uniref:uncharacterized protein n=1 Tax=Rhizomucor pusillus TaxID=4840 RepID=UPI0037438229
MIPRYPFAQIPILSLVMLAFHVVNAEMSSNYTLGSVVDEDPEAANNSAAGPAADAAGGHAQTPIVGLPISSWSILQLDDQSRASVCNQQQGFCNDQCGGGNMTTINFCNVTTMAWDCKCQNKVPDCPPYQWPVTVAECKGRESACQAGCTDESTKDLCTNACSHYYKCNRPGGPPSKLHTENPDQVPVYEVNPVGYAHVAAPSMLYYYSISLLFIGEIYSLFEQIP